MYWSRFKIGEIPEQYAVYYTPLKIDFSKNFFRMLFCIQNTIFQISLTKYIGKIWLSLPCLLTFFRNSNSFAFQEIRFDTHQFNEQCCLAMLVPCLQYVWAVEIGHQAGLPGFYETQGCCFITFCCCLAFNTYALKARMLTQVRLGIRSKLWDWSYSDGANYVSFIITLHENSYSLSDKFLRVTKMNWYGIYVVSQTILVKPKR